MKFREIKLSTGKIVFAGKNAENNEDLVKQVGKNEIVLHTKLPGSPFVNIKAESKEVLKNEIKEAGIFCAKYSQAWKKDKMKSIVVHYFLGKNIFKEKGMKTGTFGVKKFKEITVKQEDIEVKV